MFLPVLIKAMEKGLIPDSAIRMGINKLNLQRLRELNLKNLEERQKQISFYRQQLLRLPIAIHTEDANKQHYEVPAEFYVKSLGKNLKYSCAYWPEGCKTLDDAEKYALEIYCERALLQNGQRILELGCGWGSLTLFLGEKFPKSKITAISNSASQKQYIDEQAKLRGLSNIEVLTRNVAHIESFSQEIGLYDRVISIEMFEHLKNYQKMFEVLNSILSPEGKVFIHIFSHKDYSYHFETVGEDNWMGKYFFTGGQMPAHNLLPSFQKDLLLENQWAWSGVHYQKTSNAWLEKMDQNKESIMKVFDETYGADAKIWFQRWRIFYMACAELFGLDQGQEWGVSHYLFTKRE